MQASLGVNVAGCALPMCDSSWAGNQPPALMKRLGAATPAACPNLMRRFRSFVRVWIRRNLVPLKDEMSFEDWIAHAPYPEHRRKELRTVWAECGGVVTRKHYRCKSFVKTETYPGYKYPRAINSRHDAFKCLTGPFFHQVERELFKHPAFIKFVPVAERSRYIRDRLGHFTRFVATDYTSFEALFTPQLIRVCEMQLYSFMSRDVHKDAWRAIAQALPGMNVMKFSATTAWVKGVRMSGDMCTSLGNGFANLMLMEFVCSEQGVQCLGVVEGDDGLFGVDSIPDVGMFARLGMRIKFQPHTDVGRAGFCKQVFDVDVAENLVDPVELLGKFGWTHSAKRNGGPGVLRSLLRAKAFSLRSLACNAPVARSLWRWALRATEGAIPDFYAEFGSYVPSLSEVVERDVDHRSRLLVEEVFGYPIEAQLAVESWMDSQTAACEIPEKFLRSWCPTAWFDYHSRFARARRPPGL